MGDFYRSYNEEDLLVAYLTMTENTGGINSELKSAIENRFNFNEFVQKAELRTEKVREKGRISYEIYQMVLKGNDLVHVSRQMTSDILSEEELDQFVTYRFMQYYSTRKHDEVDRELIGKCIVALIVSSVLGAVFLVEMASVIQFFSFILLVPLYMFNHFLVRMITGRNRENPAVFVTVLLSVIIAAVFLIVVSLNTET